MLIRHKVSGRGGREGLWSETKERRQVLEIQLIPIVMHLGQNHTSRTDTGIQRHAGEMIADGEVLLGPRISVRGVVNSQVWHRGRWHARDPGCSVEELSVECLLGWGRVYMLQQVVVEKCLAWWLAWNTEIPDILTTILVFFFIKPPIWLKP